MGLKGSYGFHKANPKWALIIASKLLIVNVAAGGAQTNTTTRSNPVGDARTPTPSGLGGLGLPELESMFGSMPDTNSLNQIMQNPAISQMMQSLLSSPQYMNQVPFFFVIWYDHAWV